MQRKVAQYECVSGELLDVKVKSNLKFNDSIINFSFQQCILNKSLAMLNEDSNVQRVEKT